MGGMIRIYFVKISKQISQKHKTTEEDDVLHRDRCEWFTTSQGCYALGCGTRFRVECECPQGMGVKHSPPRSAPPHTHSPRGNGHYKLRGGIRDINPKQDKIVSDMHYFKY